MTSLSRYEFRLRQYCISYPSTQSNNLPHCPGWGQKACRGAPRCTGGVQLWVTGVQGSVTGVQHWVTGATWVTEVYPGFTKVILSVVLKSDWGCTSARLEIKRGSQKINRGSQKFHWGWNSCQKFTGVIDESFRGYIIYINFLGVAPQCTPVHPDGPRLGQGGRM